VEKEKVIHVFIRSHGSRDPLRQAFHDATVARWNLDPLARVCHLVNMDYREARLYAEAAADSDPYIFTDNDVLPHGKDWISKGVKAMLAHPEYGACSTKSLIVNESPFDTRPGDCDIFPVPCVGAPMWMRKNILKDDLPEHLFVSECIVLHQYMKDRGYLQGIINGIAHVHLGHGFSTDPRWVTGY
jgi:hypothetical protein